MIVCAEINDVNGSMRMQDDTATTSQATDVARNPSPLRFICSEDKEVSRLKALSNAAFFGVEALIYPSLEGALAEHGDSLIIVPTETPSQNLARRLVGTADHGKALQDWIEEAEAFLQTYRKVRRQVRVMAKAPLLKGGTDSWQAVANQFNIPLSPLPKEILETEETEPCALSHLVSLHLLQITPKAQALATEIEAMICGPCPSFEKSSELVTIVLAERKAAQTEVTELQNRLEALETQREQAVSKSELLEESVSALLRDIETQSVRQKTLARELKSMSDLEARLARSAEELLRAQQSIANKDEALKLAQEKEAALERRVVEQSDNLHALYTSNSWKITGPIRKISLFLRRR